MPRPLFILLRLIRHECMRVICRNVQWDFVVMTVWLGHERIHPQRDAKQIRVC